MTQHEDKQSKNHTTIRKQTQLTTKMSGRVYVCYDYLYLKLLNQITPNLAMTVLHSRWRLLLKIEISLLFIVTLL
jgi:hypothetical protein